jgi:ATP-dependent helicase/nuclease subunit A
MSRANPEQILAINHKGGVLLKAGAGSGKTFVLVEHVVSLIQGWMVEFKNNAQGSFEDHIRQKFSSVVMMTFTKKAAGEMNIRLSDKMSQIAETTQENVSYWKAVVEALPFLTVTTIDGFCRRLITSGYFPHLSTEAKIIFDAERLDQVRLLFERWYEEQGGNLPNDIAEIVIREKKPLLTAFRNVFSDPGLRLLWKKSDDSSTRPEMLGEVLKQSFVLNDLETALANILSLDLPAESDRSPFETIVGNFQATGLPVVDSVEKLEIYFNLFAQISRLAKQTGKKASPQHDLALEGLKPLREWARKWFAPVKDYHEHYSDKILPWIKLCKSIFLYIEKNLDPNQGMTFGDIEYYTALGLENKEYRERINKVYSYFIVDEFQDTSKVQFKIIQNLIGLNYHNLFCVGDSKQAIYGFRGGELSVFQDCEGLMPVSRSLANNYRSHPHIITMNNSLFRSILPAGMSFEGHDPFSVDPEDQNIPTEREFAETGEVEVFTASLERDHKLDGKFKPEDINRIEATIIADSIEAQRARAPLEVCTVLYSKLKPSGDLIRELMEKEIGFTAQFKIDLLDDPIVGIFLILLKRQFDSEELTKNKYPVFMITHYLDILKVTTRVGQEQLEGFDQDLKFFGLLEAFKRFLFTLNMTNENSDINFNVIETLCRIYHQDPEDILLQISYGANARASLDFRYGTNTDMVQIMTAHASKGLEFDTVYLGGIYTNGKDQVDSDLFGDEPGSFVWYTDVSQKEKQKSPFYVYENELKKHKNFSEAKRLFYVACTRAEKKLAWVDLQISEGAFSIHANSWINGLRHWMNDPQSAPALKNLTMTPVDQEKLLEAHQDSAPRLPLFFHDAVGIFTRAHEAATLGVAAELSVTKLNALVDCPRKFHLSNVLKLSPTQEKPDLARSHEESDEVQVVSSASRGTLIHEHIAAAITKNFIVAREVFETPHRAPIEWALSELKILQEDFDLVPEKALKFKLFNFMISGIPDLILYPKNSDCRAQIWDFKTGRITEENLGHYWIQLKTYAYALFTLGLVEKTEKIDVRLCFVDNKKFLDLAVDWDQLQPELFTLWNLQNEPWRVNLEHCAQCPYGDICPR